MVSNGFRLRPVAHVAIVALMASMLAVVVASPAYAATIVVDTADDEFTDNSTCSLREAIVSANDDDNTHEPDCVQGSFADIINLEDDDYVLDNGGSLFVDSDITITGDGVDETFIDGDGDPDNYECNGTGSPTDRVFEVDAAGDLTLEELTVQNGIVEQSGATEEFGGGILANGPLSLDNVRVRDNVVCTSTGDGYGGGIYSDDTLSLFESTVEDNRVESDSTGNSFGGGIYADGSIDIFASTIANNITDSPSSEGGGIHVNAGGDIVNSTISGNDADAGGGIWYDTNAGSDLTLTYVTITRNDEEGVTALTGGASQVVFEATVVANNPDETDDCDGAGVDFESNDYNLSSDGGCDFDETNDEEDTDAELESLQDNGGPTETHLPESGSPLVDVIDNTDCDSFNNDEDDRDQRDEDRPDDDECDIGAVERQSDDDDPTGGAGGDELDVTPETATNILPDDRTHTLTARYDEDELDTDDEDDINFKIISGPNSDTGGDADFQCTLLNDSCTVSYTGNGVAGTDTICAWNDLDGDDNYSVTGSASDGGSCDSETLSGGTNSSLTDVVQKIFEEQDLPQCDDGDDNDSDGDVDFPDDPGCSSTDDDSESPNPTPPTDTQCNDGVDNDGDRDVDYPNDEGCVSLQDDTENSDGPDNVARRYATLLTIEFGNRNDVFRGQALSQHGRCVRNRVVTLKRVDAGPNTAVGRDGTDRQGDWRVPTFKPNGRYYAVVARKSFTAGNGDLVVCMRDRSRTVRV